MPVQRCLRLRLERRGRPGLRGAGDAAGAAARPRHGPVHRRHTEPEVGAPSHTRFGVNAGAGLELRPRELGFFVEARYHAVLDQIWDAGRQFGAVAGARGSSGPSRFAWVRHS